MTKKEFHKIVDYPNPKDGVHVHLKHLWENNNHLGIFNITGLDFRYIMKDKDDTSGIRIPPPLFYMEYLK